jgi:voltage-gated potassium channel
MHQKNYKSVWLSVEFEEKKKHLRKLWRNDFFRVMLLIIFLGFAAATVVFLIENKDNKGFETYGNAIWWAFVSITTTGYGDITPITPWGRTVSIFVLLSGTIVLSLLSGAVSSILVTRNIRASQGLQEVKMKNHVIVCGWNSNAEIIISTLSEEADAIGGIVLINELSEEQIAAVLFQFKQSGVKFVRGNYADEEVFLRASIKDAQAVILIPDESSRVLANPDERTLLATLTVKSLSPRTKVYAHLSERSNRQALQRARADAIIVSGQHAGYLLATHALSTGVSDAIEDLMDSRVGSKFVRQNIPQVYVGKPFLDLFLYFRREEQSILVGVVSIEKTLTIADVLADGSDSYLDEFIRRRFAESGKQLNKKSRSVTLNPPDSYLIQTSDSALVIQTVK